jgi:iron complex outermembrane receptor protein
LWTPSERFEALLTVDSSTDDVNDNSADYTAPGEVTTPFTTAGLDRQVEGDANGTGQRDTFGAALRLNYELSPSLDLTSLTSYRTFEIAQFIEQDGLSVPLVNTGTDIDQTQFSQELRLTYGTDRFGWIAGAYYMRETIEDQTRAMINVPLIAGVLFPPFVVPRDSLSRSETTSTSYAAFAAFTTELSEAWTLSAGARVTRDERDIDSSAFSLINGGTGFSDAPAVGEPFAPLAGLTAVPLAVGAPTSSAEETALTGDVSLTYDWTDDVSTYLRYARGYKAGGFQTGLPTLPTALGDIVDPEFVDSYEIGFRSTALERSLIFNATAFYSIWQDRQSFRVEIIAGVPTYILFNDPESVIYGLEAELQYRPTQELTFGASLGVQETEFTESDDPTLEGREFSRVSPVTIGLTADWVHPISSDWSFRLGGDARWAQSYFFDDANTPGFKQPDYWLVNALAGFETNDGAISLRLWGRNLTDEDVVVSAVSGVPSEATAPFTPGGSRIVVNLREPRTWGVQAAFRF